MKKVIKIFSITFAVLCLVSSVYASSFEIKTEPERVVLKPGETVEFNIYIDNIDMNEKGINTVEGFIKYDDETIENIELINENDWKIKYNNNKEDELFGKFLSIKEVEGITKEEKFLKIKIKLKDEIKKEKSYITLKDLISNDGENFINAGDKEIEIKFEIEENTNEKYEDNLSEEKNKTEDTRPSNIKTGDVLPLIATGTLAVVIISNTFISIRRKRR